MESASTVVAQSGSAVGLKSVSTVAAFARSAVGESASTVVSAKCKECGGGSICSTASRSRCKVRRWGINLRARAVAPTCKECPPVKNPRPAPL